MFVVKVKFIMLELLLVAASCILSSLQPMTLDGFFPHEFR